MPTGPAAAVVHAPIARSAGTLGSPAAPEVPEDSRVFGRGLRRRSRRKRARITRARTVAKDKPGPGGASDLLAQPGSPASARKTLEPREFTAVFRIRLLTALGRVIPLMPPEIKTFPLVVAFDPVSKLRRAMHEAPGGHAGGRRPRAGGTVVELRGREARRAGRAAATGHQHLPVREQRHRVVLARRPHRSRRGPARIEDRRIYDARAWPRHATWQLVAPGGVTRAAPRRRRVGVDGAARDGQRGVRLARRPRR